MSDPQQPPDPNAKKGIVFALAPFGAWFVIVLIALAQNGGFNKIASFQNANASTDTLIALAQNGGLNKIASFQNANASTDIRSQLKECFNKLGVGARGIDEAPMKEVIDLLLECREELKKKS